MNNRKAKSIRKAVRTMGRDPRDAQTVPVKPFTVGYLINVRMGATFLGQRELKATCGRALYKSLKREVRRGAVA